MMSKWHIALYAVYSLLLLKAYMTARGLWRQENLLWYVIRAKGKRQ